MKRYGFTHLSTGDLLREEAKKKTPESAEIQKYMKEGQLVPSELVVRLAQKHIDGSIKVIDVSSLAQISAGWIPAKPREPGHLESSDKEHKGEVPAFLRLLRGDDGEEVDGSSANVR